MWRARRSRRCFPAVPSRSTQAASFHARFVQALSGAGGAYAAAEAANVSPLQTLQQDLAGLATFSPVKDMTGRPLFGNGANATTPGGNGGDAGHDPDPVTRRIGPRVPTRRGSGPRAA